MEKAPSNDICQIETCERPVKAQGLCTTHFQRLYRHGDAQAQTPVRRRQGKGVETTRLRIFVPIPLVEQLHALAVSNGLSDSAQAVEALSTYLKRHKPKRD